MINMWTSDIGRHNAANYEILKVIFECNLKLFHQTTKKKLLFVIRDFSFMQHNEQKTKERLLGDLDSIW